MLYALQAVCSNLNLLDTVFPILIFLAAWAYKRIHLTVYINYVATLNNSSVSLSRLQIISNSESYVTEFYYFTEKEYKHFEYTK